MQDTFRKMSTSFPSLEALEGFAYIYLAECLHSLSNFIHFPTLKFSSQSPHWIASIIAYGAVLTPLPTIRRFGFAVQESVRITNGILVESKINKSLDLDLFQATVILQDLGMWSVHPDDHGKVLEGKWRQWSQQESWKRLVYHYVIKDAEVSLMATTTPRVSYEELNLPLPESKDLWLAKTATEWKELYLKCWSGQTSKLPSAVDLLKDVSLLTNHIDRLDVQLSMSIYLSGSATLSHQYHQLSGIQCSRPFVTRNLAGRSHNLLNERHQELCKELRDFQQMPFQWGPQNALLIQQKVMLHLQLMQLHVSINDVYLFTGREGEDQVRNSYVILRQWTRSPEAREALWHAGQTLRYAKMLPPGTMKDFWCIAIVQAALAFWVHGIITKASKKPQENHTGSNSAVHLEDRDMGIRDNFVPHIPGCYVNEPLFLDGENNTAVMRYLSMGQGQPFIRGPAPRNPGGGDSNSNAMLQASPEDPCACVGLLYNIMMDNFGWDVGKVPLLVYNMTNMMKRLSAIAARVHS
ncbi:Zinc finger protein 497 [Ceratocystis lukuohia]|uniref:Zinc finger protein 497 n=1 Tax=Ceratocystis lukuohia TaxID=2019550 RepID=A0ABR4MEW2_9PEZI